MNAFLQLSFDCTESTAERMADMLSEAGAMAVTLADAADDPLYEPPPGALPLWSRTRVIGLFDRDADAGQILARLNDALSPAALPPARVSALEDRRWELECRKDAHPRCFADRLWVLPSWAPTIPLADGQVSLLLDPGLAFGTGAHPTTAMCMEWLAAENLTGATVIDYGCGSGILAIAAAKLGAANVWAVDSDPQALQATRDNAARNALGVEVRASAPEVLPEMQSDVLVANILARPLIEHAGRLCALLRPGARIALSGVLLDQADPVAAAYAPWCELVERRSSQEWVLLAGRRRQPRT